MEVSSSKLLVTGSITAMVGLACLIHSSNQNTVLRASKQFVNALIQNDAVQLSRFASRGELERLVASREALQKLIATKALPALRQNFDLTGIVILQQSDHIEVYIPPRKGSDLSSGLKFKFASGFEEAEAITYSYNWFMVDSTRFAKSTGNPTMDTLSSFILQIDAEQPFYEGLGFVGIYSEASGRLETWQERRQAFAAKLRRLKTL